MLLRSLSLFIIPSPEWFRNTCSLCIKTDNNNNHQFMLTSTRKSALLNTHSLAVTFVWLKWTNSVTVFCWLRHVSCEEGNIALQRGTFIIIWLGNIHLGWNMRFYVMTKCYARIILKYNNNVYYCKSPDLKVRRVKNNKNMWRNK